jgi:uncharacterized protein YkwD
MLSVLCLTCCSHSTSGWRAEDYKRLTYQTYRHEVIFQLPLDFENIDYARLQAAIFYETNAVRVRHHRSVLTYQPVLEQVARQYARRMVSAEFFDHHDPYSTALRTVEDRVRRAGVSNPLPSENLAIYFGIQYKPRLPAFPLRSQPRQFSWSRNGPAIPNHTYASLAQTVVDFWMQSPPHRDNLLAPEAVELGCGAAFFRDGQGFPKFKLVQVFQWYEPVQREQTAS